MQAEVKIEWTQHTSRDRTVSFVERLFRPTNLILLSQRCVCKSILHHTSSYVIILGIRLYNRTKASREVGFHSIMRETWEWSENTATARATRQACMIRPLYHSALFLLATKHLRQSHSECDMCMHCIAVRCHYTEKAHWSLVCLLRLTNDSGPPDPQNPLVASWEWPAQTRKKASYGWGLYVAQGMTSKPFQSCVSCQDCSLAEQLAKTLQIWRSSCVVLEPACAVHRMIAYQYETMNYLVLDKLIKQRFGSYIIVCLVVGLRNHLSKDFKSFLHFSSAWQRRKWRTGPPAARGWMLPPQQCLRHYDVTTKSRSVHKEHLHSTLKPPMCSRWCIAYLL